MTNHCFALVLFDYLCNMDHECDMDHELIFYLCICAADT